MRVGFDKADFEELAELWNRFLPARYRIDADLLRCNTVESHLFDWGASTIQVEGGRAVAFIAVKKSAASLYRGPDPDQAHITALAFEAPPAGHEAFSYAKRVLADRGAFKIVFGQDVRHFFPGCPEEAVTLHDFLMVEGFYEGRTVMDVEADLTRYEPPEECLSVLRTTDDQGETVQVRPLAESERDNLRSFLEREFPGRWRYDTFAKLAEEGVTDFVYCLWHHGAIAGFALTQSFGCKFPIAGAVWRADLGERWGALGPIGIAAELRGKGYGHALLAYSLCELKVKGVERCLIDWTVLDAFYARHGFKPSRRYREMDLFLQGTPI